MEELFGSEPESGSDAEEEAKPAKGARKRKSEAEGRKPPQKKKRAKNGDAEGVLPVAEAQVLAPEPRSVPGVARRRFRVMRSAGLPVL